MDDAIPSDDRATDPDMPASVRGRTYDRAAIRSNELVTTTYPVADLVVPIQKLRVKVSPEGAHEVLVEKPKQGADFSQLIELLTSFIQPDTWDEAGGPGSVREFQTTLSLVIRQTQAVHDEVVDLLRQLRRLQGLQVTFELSAMHVPVDFKVGTEFVLKDQDLRAALLAEQDVATLRESVKEHSHAGFYVLPRASLMNGQGLEINIPQFGRYLLPYQFVPAISPNGDAVRLSLAIGARDPLDAMSRVSTFVIPAEKSLLVDVSDELNLKPLAGLSAGQVGEIRRTLRKESGERFLLLITPRFPPPEAKEHREPFRQ